MSIPKKDLMIGRSTKNGVPANAPNGDALQARAFSAHSMKKTKTASIRPMITITKIIDKGTPS